MYNLFIIRQSKLKEVSSGNFQNVHKLRIDYITIVPYQPAIEIKNKDISLRLLLENFVAVYSFICIDCVEVDKVKLEFLVPQQKRLKES